jgi:hypothetical protein
LQHLRQRAEAALRKGLPGPESRLFRKLRKMGGIRCGAKRRLRKTAANSGKQAEQRKQAKVR